MEPKRLSKALAHAGVASRRACEKIINSGRVRVNGEVVTVPQTLVVWGKDQIILDGKKVQGEEKKVTYLLNKPKGYLCTQKRPDQKKIVTDLFPEETRRLFTVGRLDKDTEGLLIVTNDGKLANKIIHPSSNITKEYLAKTDMEISEAHLKAISFGADIDGVYVRPTKVKKMRRGTVKISVKEGRKHEVRILLESCGLGIFELTRIRIGGLQLGNLPIGSWRLMTEEDKEEIFK